MSAFSQDKGFHRIIDANLNRVKEGLRVCEEIARFMLASRKLSSGIKAVRHELDSLSAGFAEPSSLIGARQASRDVGRYNSRDEFRRSSCGDLFWANMQRAKESLRVLEEFAKLANKEAALGFKELRYKIYEIEKSSFKAISSLRNSRRPGGRRKTVRGPGKNIIRLRGRHRAVKG